MAGFWKGGFGMVVAGVLAAASSAEARPQRMIQIPNGGVGGCANCHVSSAGGGPRNSFGQQIEVGFLSPAGLSGRVQWGPELAKLDADGDGFTNGQELGDPDGLWKSGDADPGDMAAVTMPGDANSHAEPPVVSAVESTTWGQVKEAVQELFE